MKIRQLAEMDFSLLISVFVLSLFGVLFIYSSGVTSTGVVVSNEYMKQMIWVVAGIVIVFLVSLVNYRRLYDLSIYLYLGIILILIYTRIFGRIVNGAKSWIGVSIFGIQPSEFAKFTTILFLARYLDSSRSSHEEFKRFVNSSLIVLLPVTLILSQPDLGTALVFIPILLGMTFIAGSPLRYVIFLGSVIFFTGVLTVLPLWQQFILRGDHQILRMFFNNRAIAVSSIVTALISLLAIFGYKRYAKKYFYWIGYLSLIILLACLTSFIGRIVLKDYQIMRLIVFLDPNVDPRGSGWNIIQSVTAIGSGGLLGKGFLQGTQSHYRFLPQQSTDFIFSIFSEEWGFLGGLLVFTLYLLISIRLIKIMKTTTDPFGAYLCAGLASVYVFHFIVNVGMTMGVMPITGIPLLFMSYGGSSLLAAMIGIGFAMSIYMRRFEH